MRALWILAIVLASCSTPMGMADASDAADVASDVPSIDTGADASLDLSDVRVDVPMDIAPDVNCDADGDGHRAVSCGGDDCDDANPDAHPGALEYCDGIDENCDGVADYRADADGGFDPAADMACEALMPAYDAGTFANVPDPAHCYTTTRGRPPCGSMWLPTCERTWHATASPSTISCGAWADDMPSAIVNACMCF